MGTAPTVTDVSLWETALADDDTYGLGETIVVRVTFDHEVTVTGDPQVALTIGTQTRQATFFTTDVSSLTTDVRVGVQTYFLYTVQASDVDANGISIAANALGLNGGTITHAGDGTTDADLTHDAVADDSDYKVDGSQGTSPTMAYIAFNNSPASGDTYEFGETIQVVAYFDRAVTVTGSPQVALTIGTQTRQATYDETRYGHYLYFSYTVAGDDLDADGIGIAANALATGGGTIQIAGGTTGADLTHDAVADDPDHKVDGSPPTIRRVSISSVPAIGDTYEPGETIEIVVEFNRSVEVTGSPQVALTIGTETRQVTLHGLPGFASRWLYFVYTVQAADVDADGIGIAANALATGDGTIKNAVGTADADLTHDAVADDVDHKVDGSQVTPPTVSRVYVTNEPESGDTYKRGETIGIGVEFNRSVEVTGSPRVALTIGTQTRQATFDGDISGGPWLYFHYTVQAADVDADGIGIAANALGLNGATITHAGDGTTDADLTHDAVVDDSDHKVDGKLVTTPTVSSVFIASGPASGDTYEPGETIRIVVEFNRVVEVTGSPQVALTIGTQTRQATFDERLWRRAIDEFSRRRLTFHYTVQASDVDADGIGIAANALGLNGGTITHAGDDTIDADLTHDAVADDSDHKVDGKLVTTPTVSSFYVSSRPASGDTYELGETIGITVGFSRVVRVTGSPQVALTIGAQTRQATLFVTDEMIERTSTWFGFYYTVHAADVDADGIGIAANALGLNGGTITHAGDDTTNADLTHDAVADDSDYKVDGKLVTTPTVGAVAFNNSPASGDTYESGETIEVVAVFDRAVTVTGSPQVALTIGTQTRQATHSETLFSVLYFSYTVQAADVDADGIGIAANALGLNGGTIQIAGGTVPADLTHGAEPDDSSRKVHGSPPTVERLFFDSPPSDGTYKRGSTIAVTVEFNRAVRVTGSPQVALTIGTQTRQMTFGGSGDRWLYFVYTVQAEDLDADGIGIAADALSTGGGTITSPGGTVAADLTHEALADDPNHKVDGSVDPGSVGGPGGGGGPGSGDDGLEFAESEYRFELEENRDGRETSVPIGTVTAGAGQIVYAITAGNADARFAIDPDGTITYVGSGEDAEATDAYTLTVTATLGEDRATAQVTIEIKDMDDPGIVKLSTKPWVGVKLTATLSDQDVPVTDERWQWWQRKGSGAWTRIDGAAAADYTPVLVDVGKSLQARVDYTDAFGQQQAESDETEPVDLNPARRARMLQLGLTAFGRSMASTAVDVIGQRFTAAAPAATETPDVDVTLHDRALRFADWENTDGQARLLRQVTEAFGIRVSAESELSYRPVAGEELLSESSFSVGQSGEEGSGFTFWGMGDYSSFAGDVDGFKQNGTVVSGYLGADYRFSPQALVGLAASHGQLDLTSKSEQEGDGTLQGTLTSAYPYGLWRPLEWLRIWGLAGYGLGGATLGDVGGTFKGDISVMMGALGQRADVLSRGPVAVAVKADGFITRVASGGTLPEVNAEAWRMRVLLETGLELDLGEGSRLTPRVEVGGRLDGGSAERGVGTELGGELRYTHAGIGLSLAGRGRMLLVHEDGGLRDWGASAAVRWSPPGAAEGLAMSVAPVWGRPASGVDALWQDRQVVRAGDDGDAEPRAGSPWLPDTVEVKLSYGLGSADGAGLLTPYTEVGFSGTEARRIRTGTRWELAGAADVGRVNLEAFGERTARRDDAPAYRVGLSGTLVY